MQIPVWIQLVWAIGGMMIFPAAVTWTLVVFWPHLRMAARKTDLLIQMNREAREELTKELRESGERLEKALVKLAENQGKLGDAQKVAIGVQVLTSLIPLFLNSVTAARETVKKK